jgi:hypothetical protein
VGAGDGLAGVALEVVELVVEEMALGLVLDWREKVKGEL